MNFTKSLFLLFLFLSSTALFAQKGRSKEITVSAVKLTPAVAKALSRSQASPFLLEVSGIMRATKGYKFIYNVSKGVFLIKPIDSPPDATPTDGKKDLGGGITLRCIGCNACDVGVIADGPTGTNYGCGGSCSGGKTCMGFIQVPKKSVQEYQTPEGGSNWMDL